MDEHRIDRVRVSRGEGAEGAAIIGQVETGESAEAATAEAAATEAGDQDHTAGGEDSLSASTGPDAAPDTGARQQLPAENGTSPDPVHAADESGHEDTRPVMENRASH